jgi:hypothetical protein
MRRILSKCPNCGGDLEVTRLSCKSCETVILARYEPCKWCKLAPENLDFIELFVKNRGNLKDMERELGQSYWALRTRLNDVVRELGYEAGPDQAGEGPQSAEEKPGNEEELAAVRREILSKLSEGKINASQAAEQLARLKRADRT